MCYAIGSLSEGPMDTFHPCVVELSMWHCLIDLGLGILVWTFSMFSIGIPHLFYTNGGECRVFNKYKQ